MTYTPVERFAAALRFPTVSARIDEQEVRDAFTALLDFLAASYPTLFATATVDRQDPWRLVIEVPGTDPSLDPILLLAHFDVVDVAETTRSDWSHDPFGGEIDAGFVWGRGALDDKNVLIALLEAAETVVAEGRPLRRGFVLAFGGDEELSGRQGAARIAADLRAAERRFHFTLDEGAIIAVGMLATPKRPIALIGVAEKGQVNVVIRARSEGGHAAMPPRRTAVGNVATAVARLERTPFGTRLLPTVRAFFIALARHASNPLKLVYRFPGLFWPILRAVLAASPRSAALVRTTQAATMARGSHAPNVLAQSAETVVNIRILPGETVDTVVRRYRRLLRRFDVEVSVLSAGDAHDPIAESPVDHPGYRAVAGIAESLFDCIAAPYLVTATTDSKWYAPISEAVLRFVPMALTTEELARVHGTDERISTESFTGLIEFYETLIRRMCNE